MVVLWGVALGLWGRRSTRTVQASDGGGAPRGTHGDGDGRGTIGELKRRGEDKS